MLYVLSYVQGESLIQHNDQEIIKVGFSSSWTTRLQAYKTGLPLPVRVFGTTDGDRDDESKLHRSLSAHRASGEWYYYTDELISALGETFVLEPYEVHRRRKDIGTGWKPKPNKSVKITVPDRFVKWLDDMKPGEVYDLKDFQKTLTKKEAGALRTSFSTPTSLSYRYLETNGIVKESRGCAGTRFYYKEN